MAEKQSEFIETLPTNKNRDELQKEIDKEEAMLEINKMLLSGGDIGKEKRKIVEEDTKIIEQMKKEKQDKQRKKGLPRVCNCGVRHSREETCKEWK